MARGAKDFQHRTVFDYAPGIHHGNAVSDLSDNSQVVSYEK
jgi:hypothetical protein